MCRCPQRAEGIRTPCCESPHTHTHTHTTYHTQRHHPDTHTYTHRYTHTDKINAFSLRLTRVVVALGSSAIECCPPWSLDRLSSWGLLLGPSGPATSPTCGLFPVQSAQEDPVPKFSLLRWGSPAWHWGEDKDTEAIVSSFLREQSLLPTGKPSSWVHWLSHVTPHRGCTSESLVKSPSSFASLAAGLAIRTGERLCGGLETWQRELVTPYRADENTHTCHEICWGSVSPPKQFNSCESLSSG